MTTARPAVPDASDPQPSSPMVAAGGRRWFRRRTMAAVLLVGAVLGVVGAALIRVPYYSLGPGTVRAAEAMIELDGGRRDPDAGSIAFATVAVDGRLNLWQTLSAWWDPDVAVVPEVRLLGDQTPAESDAHNRLLMDDSKLQAVGAALGWLGLSSPVGARIAMVSPSGAAAGVLVPGDVVVSVDGTPIGSASEFVERIRAATVGAPLTLGVLADDSDGSAGWLTASFDAASARSTVVVLGSDGGSPARPVLGVTVRDAFVVRYDGVVSIDSGHVGGPSAGLAFSLGIVDLLTGGDLGGGLKVVATGTVSADGTVGVVGGLEQKVVAVRRAGASLFLVPEAQGPEQVARIRALAGEVEVVAVGSVAEAVQVLETHGGVVEGIPH